MGNKIKFTSEINQFIQRSQFIESIRDSINCKNCFCDENLYVEEEALIKRIQDNDFTDTNKKGDCLEEVIKLLFSRIKIIHTPRITNLDSSLGQIDIQIVAPDLQAFFNILGIHKDYPRIIIGECKNWTTKKVGREDIEKIC
jgi:hypothetical protein